MMRAMDGSGVGRWALGVGRRAWGVEHVAVNDERGAGRKGEAHLEGSWQP